MLKIKDNVDLKELEKFGFKLDQDEWYLKRVKRCYIFIKPLSRQIIIRASTYGEEIEQIEVIYDLIQAGLVEKVEEEIK